MFSELTSSFFSLGWRSDEKIRQLEAWILFGEDYTLCVKIVFLLYFFEGEDLKIQLSWKLKGVNIGMALWL